MIDYAALVQECETEIRAGRAAAVPKRLSGVNTAHVPRESRLPLANLARRVGLIALGLKLLAPVVRPRDSKPDPTSRERAEYAVLLQRHGAANEAYGILTGVEAAEVPEAWLYRAFVHFGHWDYSTAITALEEYIRVAPSAYMSFVGRVNLAAAYVGLDRAAEAFELLNQNIAYAKENKYGKLEGNCLELRSQLSIASGDFSSAKHDLSTAAARFGSAQTLDHLFVRKWQAIIRSLEEREAGPILNFRKEALTKADWQGAREADLYLLKLQHDNKKFEHLYFGTPFALYRERVTTRLDGRRPDKTFCVYGDRAQAPLDLLSGERNGHELLVPGSKTHQVIEILLRDFYAPSRLGSLFGELFPGEHFDIFTSPDRVHQILRRARTWLDEAKLPVAIEEKNENYSLKIGIGFSVRVPLDRRPVAGPNIYLLQLREHFGEAHDFGAREARAKLGVSPTTFKRFASWAIEEGRLKKTGDKNATRYQLANAG